MMKYVHLLVAFVFCMGISHTTLSAQKQVVSERQARTHQLYTQCIGVAPREKAEQELAILIRTHYIDAKDVYGSPIKLAIETCLAKIQKLPHLNTANESESSDLGFVKHTSSGYTVDTRISSWRHVALPHVWDYIDSLARDIDETYPKRQAPHFLVTSLLRPVDLQQKISRAGGSTAACIENTVCSTHTNGTTFDISLRSLNPDIRMRLISRLTQDMRTGKVLFILEPISNCIHVFVLDPKQPLPF